MGMWRTVSDWSVVVSCWRLFWSCQLLITEMDELMVVQLLEAATPSKKVPFRVVFLAICLSFIHSFYHSLPSFFEVFFFFLVPSSHFHSAAQNWLWRCRIWIGYCSGGLCRRVFQTPDDQRYVYYVHFLCGFDESELDVEWIQVVWSDCVLDIYSWSRRVWRNKWVKNSNSHSDAWK